MAMHVEMTFLGDVICYQKNEEWKFIFPTDESHVLKFSQDGSKPVELRTPPDNRYIDIDSTVRLEPVPNPNDSFHGLLNMSSDSMHRTTDGKSNLFEGDNSPTDRELIFMSVPAGRTGQSTMTKANYWVDDSDVIGHETKLGRRVAATVSLIIDLNHNVGFDVVMRDTGDTIASIVYRDGTTSSLVFDNHCDGLCKSPDDFLHYYDWLSDWKNPGRRMYAGKEPRRNFAKGEKSSSTMGNCDPVGSEPPPEP